MSRSTRTLLLAVAAGHGGAGAYAATPFLSSEGRITVFGEGSASAAPEFARMLINVTSICYNKSSDAKEANAVLANKIMAVLRSFAGDATKISALGGANTLASESIYRNNQYETLCTLKWRAGNALSIDGLGIDMVPALQDQVLAVTDATGAPNPDLTIQTFAELGAPSFHLTPATMQRLQSEAQGQAYDDAKRQLDTFAARAGLGEPRLEAISPPTVEVIQPRSDGDIQAEPSSSAETPIAPGAIVVHAKWKFEWSFTTGGRG